MNDVLSGRRIVLGITGGVAAYKAAELCRQLVRGGAFVSPVLTDGAQRFITSATFSAIASEPARSSLWQGPEASPHTDLARDADLIVVAPATANLLAAARAGLASDLLTATLLATTAPVVLCPAMHTEMWEHPATQENLAVLRERGARIVPPEDGELAGGDMGTGRLAATDRILDACVEALHSRGAAPPEQDLAGATVLVSAGGTREALDPVRFIGNRSSGKQGHALALAARARGARVLLVTAATVGRELRSAGIDVCEVRTAEELHAAMLERAAAADVVVMAAAVADFRPSQCAPIKLKRRDGLPQISLVPTPDILAALVAGRLPGQIVVGFAAETDHLDRNAREKLARTGADVLVANDISRAGAGFECDTNAVTIYRGAAEGGIDDSLVVELTSKRIVADRVLDVVNDARRAQDSSILPSGAAG